MLGPFLMTLGPGDSLGAAQSGCLGGLQARGEGEKNKNLSLNKARAEGAIGDVVLVAQTEQVMSSAEPQIKCYRARVMTQAELVDIRARRAVGALVWEEVEDWANANVWPYDAPTQEAWKQCAGC